MTDDVNDEPRRESFKESKLKDEPPSDVRVEADSGVILRERVQRLANSQGATLLFTYTQLDMDGQVIADADGAPLVSPAHEVTIAGEAASALGGKGVANAIRAGREVAVARAVDHFAGLAKLSSLMASRL